MSTTIEIMSINKMKQQFYMYYGNVIFIKKEPFVSTVCNLFVAMVAITYMLESWRWRNHNGRLWDITSLIIKQHFPNHHFLTFITFTSMLHKITFLLLDHQTCQTIHTL